MFYYYHWCSTKIALNKFLAWYVPVLWGEGHVGFGWDPVGIGIGI